MPTVVELRIEARERGLRGYSAMNKAQLLQLLTAPSGGFSTPRKAPSSPRIPPAPKKSARKLF